MSLAPLRSRIDATDKIQSHKIRLPSRFVSMQPKDGEIPVHLLLRFKSQVDTAELPAAVIVFKSYEKKKKHSKNHRHILVIYLMSAVCICSVESSKDNEERGVSKFLTRPTLSLLQQQQQQQLHLAQTLSQSWGPLHSGVAGVTRAPPNRLGMKTYKQFRFVTCISARGSRTIGEKGCRAHGKVATPSEQDKPSIFCMNSVNTANSEKF